MTSIPPQVGNQENAPQGGIPPLAKIFGLDHDVNVQIRGHSYDIPPTVLDPPGSQLNGSLSIKKPTIDIVPRPPKGVLRKTTHNPNARATQYYSIVEDSAQVPYVM